MGKLPFYIISSDATAHILPAICYLYNKYWGSEQKFKILGNHPPKHKLPENFEFIKIKDDNNIKHWTRYLYNYILHYEPSDYFVLTLDDYLPNALLRPEVLETLIIAARKKGKVGRIMLGRCPEERCEEDGNGLLRLKQDALYRLSCQTSVWNKEYFLKYFNHDWKPWDLELKGSKLAKNDGWEIIGVKNDIPFDWVEESALSGRWPGMINVLGLQKEDLKYFIEQGIFAPEKLQYGMWTESSVPLFSEVGYDFKFSLIKDRVSEDIFNTTFRHYQGLYGPEELVAEKSLPAASNNQNLAHKSLRNSTYSFLGYTLPIIFAILVTPVLVRRLGSDEYGIYILANTIMGFLNLMDLGVGQAILKYLSAHVGSKNPERLVRIFAAGNFMFLLIGVFGVGAFLLIGGFLLPWFKISEQAAPHVRVVFLLTSLVFLFNSLAVVQANALKALQRYDLTVKIGLFYVTFSNLLALAAVLLRYQLKAVVAVNAASSLLALMLLSYFVKKNYPAVKSFAAKYHREEFGRFYRFGGIVFVTNIANNALAQLDRLLIPSYYNPTQLAYYSLPGSVGEKINGAASTSTGFLFPMLSSLNAMGEKEKGKIIYERIMRNVAVFATALAVVASLFADNILRYWVGEDFARHGAAILVILSFTNAILALYGVLQNTLLGLGRVKFLMKQSLFMAVLNLALLLWLLPAYGIKGAAWTYLISVLPVFIAMAWAERKFFQLQGRLKFYALLAGKLAVVSAIISVLYFGAVSRLTNDLISLILAGGFMFATFLFLYWILGFFEKEDISAYQKFLALIKAKLFRLVCVQSKKYF